MTNKLEHIVCQTPNERDACRGSKYIQSHISKDKRKGWLKPRCIAKIGDREISLRGYSWLYFANAIMRPSCYECDYTNTDRVGDFTIGDFWKVRTKVPEMFNPRGTSFLMLNTDKAEKFFVEAKQNLIYKEVTLDDVIQNNMKHPTSSPVFRKEVMNDFGHKSVSFFFEKWELKLLIEKLKKLVR